MTPKDPQKPPKVAANLVKGHAVGASFPGADAKSAVEVEVDAEAVVDVDVVENNGLDNMVGLDEDDGDDAAFRTEAPPLGGNLENKWAVSVSDSDFILDVCRTL